MNKEQFLDVMDDIGDDLIENFLNIPSSRSYAPKRMTLRKIAVSAAVVVCAVTTGLFAILRQQPHSVPSPGDSRSMGSISNPENDPASISIHESDPVSISIRESDPVSISIRESDPASISIRESDPISISIPEKNDNDPFGYNQTQFTADFSVENKTFISQPIVKILDKKYAQIALEYSGATEKNPLCISFCRKDDLGYWVVSEEIRITEGYANKMKIDYTRAASPGDEIMLMITTTNENAYAKGSWIP